MNRLILFIVNHRHWFLLLLLEIIALSFLFNQGLYRQGLRLYAQNQIVGRVNEAMTQAYSYINLRVDNERLLLEKATLENELASLKRRVEDAVALQELPSDLLSPAGQPYSYVVARIVSLTSLLGDSYYLINQGTRAGIKVDMPVMSQDGVVGIVTEVASSYSVVIPVINSKLRLSCMVQGKGYQGQLNAQGRGRPVVMGGVPLHADIAPGDTIVTSGYSYIFPEGTMVGVVQGADSTGLMTGADAAFGTYQVSLATDFERLRYVYVILHEPASEILELEKSTTPL